MTGFLPIRPDRHGIAQAVAALRRGELLGLPTETVYGLAGDAENAEAIGRIFQLKGRPPDHPLIVHIARQEELSHWASEVTEAAQHLAGAFWPGPLTLVLNKHPRVLDSITGGQDSVALRMPSHPVARAVLSAFAGGLAAPSANRFGHVSPTSAQHVRDEFGEALPLILDGGDCAVGIESTIVDVRGNAVRVLRPGVLTLSELREVWPQLEPGTVAQSPRVSGALESHYAPQTPAELLGAEQLARRLGQLQAAGLRCTVLGMEGAEPRRYAHQLYRRLRAADRAQVDRILIEMPPQHEAWDGVLDRLRRAVAK